FSQLRACYLVVFFFSSRRRHTRFSRDWSSDVCSSDLKWVAQVVICHLDLPFYQCFPYFGRRDGNIVNVLFRYFLYPITKYRSKRSEERRVGKECRSRGSPDG